MKLFMLTLLLAAGVLPAAAQIFNQNGGMRRNNIQQIALLQTYLGFVKSGYKVVGDGVGLVRRISNGEWGLHKDFFSSLGTVDPRIKNYSRVAQTIACQTQILRECRNGRRALWEAGNFSAAELDYFYGVYSRLIDQSAKSIRHLTDLVSSGKLELTDDQRLTRIDALWAEVRSQYDFVLRFNQQARLLDMQRKLEASETSDLQLLYQLK